jgi:hypothetical protein
VGLFARSEYREVYRPLLSIKNKNQKRRKNAAARLCVPRLCNDLMADNGLLTTMSVLTALPAHGMRFGGCNDLFMWDLRQTIAAVDLQAVS